MLGVGGLPCSGDGVVEGGSIGEPGDGGDIVGCGVSWLGDKVVGDGPIGVNGEGVIGLRGVGGCSTGGKGVCGGDFGVSCGGGEGDDFTCVQYFLKYGSK